MKLQPANIKELQEALRNADTLVDSIDLSTLAELLEHAPEDMTATVQAGMTLADFQARLAMKNQWLPIDPPRPAELTIGTLLNGNASGPRRFGYGTIRDWLIGLAVALPDGRLVRNGGKVVKNVAGFDLCKLFIGSQGTLGVIVEATFKLQPRPETEIYLAKSTTTIEEAGDLVDVIWGSNLQPCVLDLYQLDCSTVTVVVGFSGPAADVQAQARKARDMGIHEETNLNYDATFRTQAYVTKSVSPSRLIKTLNAADHTEFVARAGNGVFYLRHPQPEHHGKDREKKEDLAGELSGLERRIKAEFDPENKLPCLRSS